jgi:hypothetical protein
VKVIGQAEPGNLVLQAAHIDGLKGFGSDVCLSAAISVQRDDGGDIDEVSAAFFEKMMYGRRTPSR